METDVLVNIRMVNIICCSGKFRVAQKTSWKQWPAYLLHTV